MRTCVWQSNAPVGYFDFSSATSGSETLFAGPGPLWILSTKVHQKFRVSGSTTFANHLRPTCRWAVAQVPPDSGSTSQRPNAAKKIESVNSGTKVGVFEVVPTYMPTLTSACLCRELIKK